MRRLTVRWGAGRTPGAADWECTGNRLPLSLRKVSNEAADLFNSKDTLKGTAAVQFAMAAMGDQHLVHLLR